MDLVTGTMLASQVIQGQGEYLELEDSWTEVSFVCSDPNGLLPSQTPTELKFYHTPSDSFVDWKVQASVTLKNFVDVKLTVSPNKHLYNESDPIRVFVEGDAFHLRYKRNSTRMLPIAAFPPTPKLKDDSGNEEDTDCSEEHFFSQKKAMEG